MKFVRSSKRILIISVVLIFVVLITSTIMQDRSQPVQSTSIPPSETPTISFTLHIPDKALWKNYLHVSAETSAGTTCRLTYIPPMGTTQVMNTTADENGLCSWRWKISEEEGKGPGRLIFTIDGISETHFIEIRRSF